MYLLLTLGDSARINNSVRKNRINGRRDKVVRKIERSSALDSNSEISIQLISKK
jgi:hypothetical protein